MYPDRNLILIKLCHFESTADTGKQRARGKKVTRGRTGAGTGPPATLLPDPAPLVRATPIFLLTVGPIFIAQLYGKTLSTSELVLVGFMATLLGPTSAGTIGLMTLSQVGIICGCLGLPFEAAFARFIAVDARQRRSTAAGSGRLGRRAKPGQAQPISSRSLRLTTALWWRAALPLGARASV